MAMVTQPRKFTKVSLNSTHKASCNSTYFSNSVPSTWAHSPQCPSRGCRRDA